jgi:hypothetical protein
MFHVHTYFSPAWIVAPNRNFNNHNHFILKFQGYYVKKYENYMKNRSLGRNYHKATEFTTISKASACTKLCKKILFFSYLRMGNIYYI